MKDRHRKQLKNNFLPIFLALNTWLVGSLSMPVQAQTKVNPTAPVSTNKFKVTFNPPGQKQPKTTTGAASRSLEQCGSPSTGSLSLMPLLPSGFKALTVASHPTVLAYLPASSARKVFLSWQDENKENIYQATIPISGKAGIYSLSLDKNAPSLAIGKSYYWTLAMMCDNKLKPDSLIIRGQIERVELKSDLAWKLATSSPMERASLYSQAGIWYEAVATLAQLKTASANDPDLALTWQEFLTSVGLAKIAPAPLITTEQITN